MSQVDELLAAYNAQLRAHVHDRLPESVRVERDGPLVRTLRFGNRGFVEYRDLDGLAGEELDTLISRQVHVFAESGESFEWKLHGHDSPADLPDRLRAAGLVSEATETVMIGRVGAVAVEPSLPDGVVIREVREPGEFAWIVQLVESIFGAPTRSFFDDLAEER